MVDLRRGMRVVMAAAAAAVVGGGCSASNERPMSAALFMPPTVANAAPAEAMGDAAAAQPARASLRPDDAGDAAGSPKKAMILTPGPSQSFDTVRPLTPLAPPGPPTTAPVAVDAPPTPAEPAPALEPSPVEGSTPASPGVYMTVGGVLAQVNETPIYAHTVLALLDRELAARARDMEPEEFRRFAADRIVTQVHELIRDELDYASALKSLTADDQKTARLIAAEQRGEKVKQAGGSSELAKRRAMEDGGDFDELMNREYRRVVVGLYQRKEIDPQVQVSAQDMRDFYNANAAKLYGDKDRLQFRVIEVDPARIMGDHPKEAAAAAAAAVRAKAVGGADFKTLASSAANLDDGLRSTGGDVGGWMDRGSYRVDAVEAALWALKPGGITPVVEAEDAFFVAKLEDKHEGRTKPFDDPAVQDDVTKRLTQQQMAALWERVRDSAMGDAVVYAPEDRLNTALEMVMQKYARWSGR